MSSFWSIALSVAVILSFVLIGFGIRHAMRDQGRERLRGILMVVAGLVILGNVYLYTTAPASPPPPPGTPAAGEGGSASNEDPVGNEKDNRS